MRLQITFQFNKQLGIQIIMKIYTRIKFKGWVQYNPLISKANAMYYLRNEQLKMTYIFE